MPEKIITRASAVLLMLVLAACGGDGGSSSLSGVGDNDTGSGDGTDDVTETISVGSIQLINESPQISTNGSDSSLITAIVKDSGGRVIEGADIIFSADNDGTIYNQDSVTDENGQASATVSAGNNPRNRTITISATAGDISETTTVAVKGTQISLSGPSSITVGGSGTFTARLLNSSNSPIVGETVTIKSALDNTIRNIPSYTTTSDGTVSFDILANFGGTETITVTAYNGESLVQATKDITISPDQFSFTTPETSTEIELNNTQKIEIKWLSNGTPVADGKSIVFETNRGSFTQTGQSTATVSTSNGTASVEIISTNVGSALVTARSEEADGPSAQTSVEFVSTTPAQLSLQADKATIGQNESAVILATVRDIKNNLVKNATVNFTLEDVTGGTLSSGTGETNSQGQTQVTYTSSSESSALDGVAITATVLGTTISKTLNLTVGGQALRINIGTGNEIVESGMTLYKQPWTAIVTDASGAASENSSVQVSVNPVRYFKGYYTKPEGSDTWISVYSDEYGCLSEDINNNGILDPDDIDANANGTLEPAPSATVPTDLTTGADGTVTFDLTYLKSECSWVEVELVATTNVNGTESQAKRTFTLDCTADDLKSDAPPGGVFSPYGIALSCADPD